MSSSHVNLDTYCMATTQIGHSLGGALAELDCVLMALNLPSNIQIQGVTYGTPRVGNSAWATLFDSTVKLV